MKICYLCDKCKKEAIVIMNGEKLCRECAFNSQMIEDFFEMENFSVLDTTNQLDFVLTKTYIDDGVISWEAQSNEDNYYIEEVYEEQNINIQDISERFLKKILDTVLVKTIEKNSVCSCLANVGTFSITEESGSPCFIVDGKTCEPEQFINFLRPYSEGFQINYTIRSWCSSHLTKDDYMLPINLNGTGILQDVRKLIVGWCQIGVDCSVNEKELYNVFYPLAAFGIENIKNRIEYLQEINATQGENVKRQAWQLIEDLLWDKPDFLKQIQKDKWFDKPEI